MQTSDLRQRIEREQNAVDLGTRHPVPGTPRWDAQFGRGWTAAGVAGGLCFVGGVAAATVTDGDADHVRGLAVSVGSVAALFLFAMAYLSRYRIGFGLQNGVIWPDERPGLYWTLIGTVTTLCVATLTAAVWAILHGDRVAKFLASG